MAEVPDWITLAQFRLLATLVENGEMDRGRIPLTSNTGHVCVNVLRTDEPTS